MVSEENKILVDKDISNSDFFDIYIKEYLKKPDIKTIYYVNSSNKEINNVSIHKT